MKILHLLALISFANQPINRQKLKISILRREIEPPAALWLDPIFPLLPPRNMLGAVGQGIAMARALRHARAI